MIVLSFLWSLLILWAACHRMKDPDKPRPGAFAAVGFALLAWPCLGGAMLFPAWYVYFTLLAVMPGRFLVKTRRPFLRDGLAAFAVGWLFAAGTAYFLEVGRPDPTGDYPFESLSERLPRRVPSPDNTPAVDEDYERFVRNDSHRSDQLERLHESTLARFVESEGFGVGRMTRRRSEDVDSPRAETTIAQPEPGLSASASAVAEDDGLAPGPAAAPFADLHRAAVLDFANPLGFGYVRDRTHVAGFRPHQFSKTPDAEAYRASRVDLVSLLTHETPVAYVSAELPRMDRLRGAPTRPLTPFESQAISRLRKGEQLVTADAPGGVRMVGAIRSAPACAKCHDGSRGSLLGAFSYLLRPAR